MNTSKEVMKYVQAGGIQTNFNTKITIAGMNGIKVAKEMIANAQMYTKWEAAGRYDLHFIVRVDSIEKALRLAQQ